MCALFTIFKCNLQHIHRSIIITISRAPRNCFSFGRQSLFYFVRIARFPVCCFGWLFVFSLWIIQLSFNGIKVLSGELFVRATRKIYSVQRLNSTHTHIHSPTATQCHETNDKRIHWLKSNLQSVGKETSRISTSEFVIVFQFLLISRSHT